MAHKDFVKTDSRLTIRAVDVAEPVAQALIAELNAELSATYPELGATHFRLDPDEVAADRGAFLVAYDATSDRPLGCGAVRRIEHGTGEIKRMYVGKSVV